MLGWVQEMVKLLPALMCGTPIRGLQVTGYVKVLEHERQSAGHHLKELFQLFLLLSPYHPAPTQHWNEGVTLKSEFALIYLVQPMCTNTLQYKPLYFKAADFRRSQPG